MSFIGSKISLISNSKVRYEGTLYTIDPQGSTIALQNVKCMGTEDRKVEKKIKSSNTIYEFMIFNGENIKNLELIEEATNEFHDPAILDAKIASSDKQVQDNYQQQRGWTSQYNQGGYYGGDGRPFNSRGGGNRGRGRGRGRGGRLNQRYDNRGGFSGKNRRRIAGNDLQVLAEGGAAPARGSGKVNNRRKGGNNSNRNVNKKNEKKGSPGTGKFLDRQSKNNDDEDLEIKDKEFDFQGNLARFDMSSMKEALTDDKNADGDNNEPEDAEDATEVNGTENDDDNKEVKEEAEKDEKPPPAYKHDDFFDTLSTDRETYKRASVTEMKNLDAETFGKDGATYRCKTRWFRRWRGNFRGRGAFRGGYSQRSGD